MHKTGGAVFIAQHGKKNIGCIVGIIKPQPKKIWSIFPFKNGRIIELYVDARIEERVGYRLLKNGKILYSKMHCFELDVL